MKPYTLKSYRPQNPNINDIDHNTRILVTVDALDVTRLLLEEFLVDQDSLKAPYRNEALCEKAEALLASFDK